MPTLPHEAYYLWTSIREGRGAVARGERRIARLATEELEAMVMHTASGMIRKRAADAIVSLQAMRLARFGAQR
jgi:hypothetical protein